MSKGKAIEDLDLDKNVFGPYVKFDIYYIHEKIYQYNKDLGGDIKTEDKEVERLDIFNQKTETIKTSFKLLKNAQNERNTLKKDNCNKDKCTKMTRDIKDRFDKIDEQMEELTHYLRLQVKSSKISQIEQDKKENIIHNFLTVFNNYKKKEEKSLQIEIVLDEDDKMILNFQPFETNTDSFIPGTETGDHDVEVDTRELTDKEKEALEKWQKDDEELAEQIDEIDNQLDFQIDNIEIVIENLSDQKDLIKQRNMDVNKLSKNLGTQSAKLKRVVGNWRSAPSVMVDITLIIIQCVLFMVLLCTIKRVYF